MKHSKKQEKISVIGIGRVGMSALSGVRRILQHNANLQIQFTCWNFKGIELSREKENVPTNAEDIVVNVNDIIDFSRFKGRLSFVIVGLEGKTGAMANVITEALQKNGSAVIGVGIMPYDFEGATEKAKRALKLLGEKTVATIVLHNQQIKEQYGKMPLSSALQEAHKVIAEVIFHISSNNYRSFIFRYRLKRFIDKLNNPRVTFYK
ncbi:MAG: hypothetical protein J6Y55_07090 [Bacteroidales bacterium]|nr:hypothetical protein [Bacteroidales bacterium]